MKKTIVLMVLFLAAFSCSEGSNKLDENLTVERVTPVGSVGGVVFDAVTEAAINPDLTAVNVSIIAGSTPQTTTTNQGGRFFFDEVSASGNVVVLVEAEGYFSAEMVGAFVNAAGNFPVDNSILSFPPIALIPVAADPLGIRLITEDGLPATGVFLTLRTQVRYLAFADGEYEPMGDVVVSATTDQDGKASFAGLPDFLVLGDRVEDAMTLTIPPVDVDGDGNYDYEGGSRLVYFFNAEGPERTVVLETGAEFTGALEIEASNLQELEGGSNDPPGTISPSGPIYVLFNLPVESGSLLVRVVDELDENTVEVNHTLDGRFMTINFPTPLAEGAKYHLAIHAMTNVGDSVREGNFYAPVFTGFSAAPRRWRF